MFFLAHHNLQHNSAPHRLRFPYSEKYEYQKRHHNRRALLFKSSWIESGPIPTITVGIKDMSYTSEERNEKEYASEKSYTDLQSIISNAGMLLRKVVGGQYHALY